MHADHIGHKSLLAKMYPPEAHSPIYTHTPTRLGVVLGVDGAIDPDAENDQISE